MDLQIFQCLIYLAHVTRSWDVRPKCRFFLQRNPALCLSLAEALPA